VGARNRVGVAGKGAALFFGEDEGPEVAPVEEVRTETAPEGETGPATEMVAAEATVSAPSEAGIVPAPLMTAASAPSTASAADAPVETPASEQASQLASVLALPLTPPISIEAVRRIVKVVGREVSFCRVSPEEKAQLAEIVYTYKRRGVRTSENEINRIALNAILLDYATNGAQSLLARTIAALHD
jgi:hypothetical protein